MGCVRDPAHMRCCAACEEREVVHVDSVWRLLGELQVARFADLEQRPVRDQVCADRDQLVLQAKYHEALFVAREGHAYSQPQLIIIKFTTKGHLLFEIAIANFIIIIIIEGLSLLQSIPPTTANKRLTSPLIKYTLMRRGVIQIEILSPAADFVMY